VPIVDRSLYRDEQALGLSCSAFCEFLNPFTSSHSLERRRYKQRLKMEAEAANMATENVNPLADDTDTTESDTIESEAAASSK
jgi:hypothetical protein